MFKLTNEQKETLKSFIRRNPNSIIPFIEANLTEQQVTNFVLRAKEIPEHRDEIVNFINEAAKTTLTPLELGQKVKDFIDGV